MKKEIALIVLITACAMGIAYGQDLDIASANIRVPMPAVIAPAKAAKDTVTLYGSVYLSGNCWVNNNNVSGWVTGWLDLKDTTGQYTSSKYIQQYVSFMAMSPAYVSGYIYLNEYMVVQSSGVNMGRVIVHENVMLSGFSSGTSVWLTGSARPIETFYIALTKEQLVAKP